MRASAPVISSPVTNPLRAYSRDLEARPGAPTLGAEDGVWLELALALYRVAGLGPEAREAYANALRHPGREAAHDSTGLAPDDAAGDAAADATGDPGGSSAAGRPAADVPSLVRGLCDGGDDERQDALSVLQDIVADMENHHAFHLAFATLSAARRAAPDLSPLLAGRLTAQQGRVARQLGDLDTAADLYAIVLDLGTMHGERELIVRGHVGAALVAETHGNFPAARAEYHRALEHADAAPRVAASAHHGLMVAASTAGDLDTAFRHAWAAFEGVAGDPVRRIDGLINLAELARKADAARVALRAFRAALEHTHLARLRLPALGGAAQSAAVLGEVETVMSIAVQAEREAAVSGMPYENAKLWRELAEAFLEIDDTRRAAEYARRAREIAESHGFHEVDIRAEELERGIARRVARRGAPEARNAAARDILRRLDALADAGREAVVG